MSTTIPAAIASAALTLGSASSVLDEWHVRMRPAQLLPRRTIRVRIMTVLAWLECCAATAFLAYLTVGPLLMRLDPAALVGIAARLPQ